MAFKRSPDYNDFLLTTACQALRSMAGADRAVGAARPLRCLFEMASPTFSQQRHDGLVRRPINPARAYPALSFPASPPPARCETVRVCASTRQTCIWITAAKKHGPPASTNSSTGSTNRFPRSSSATSTRLFDLVLYASYWRTDSPLHSMQVPWARSMDSVAGRARVPSTMCFSAVISAC